MDFVLKNELKNRLFQNSKIHSYGFAQSFLLQQLPGCSWHSGTASVKEWKVPLNKLAKVSNSDINLHRKHRGNSLTLRETVDFRLPYLNKMELHD